MKKILFFICAMFIACVARADTININWLNEDGTTYDTSTCTLGGDLNIPNTTPEKRGYTFEGWVPADIKRIEYIESTGVQYIDTNYVPNQNTKFRVKLNMSATTGGMIIGSGVGAKDVRLYNYEQHIYYDRNGARINGFEFKNGVTYDFLVGEFYVKNYQNDEILLGSVKQNPGAWTGPSTMKIFRSTLSAPGKIYLLQIWDNDVLVRDMITVLDSNGVACMYDKVTQHFFCNAASTTGFKAGAVINE